MAPPSIWDSKPGLRAFLVACISEKKTTVEIREAIRSEFGVIVTTGTIWQQQKRMESTWANRTASGLATPVGGFASCVPSPGPLHQHQKGWEPRVEITGDEGIGITDVLDSEQTLQNEADLIRGWQLDPEHWRILPPLTANKWQTTTMVGTGEDRHPEQTWNFQYKAKLVRREKHPDLAPLIAEIAAHRKSKARPVATSGDSSGASLVVCWSDTQMGKSDGDGVDGTVARCLEKIDALEAHVRKLRKSGEQLDTLYVFGMGDLIESCSEHYAQQTFRVDLNLRDQVKVMRRLIAKAIERWAPLFPKVVVGCIGGNHGENRAGGKSHTDFADNHDVAIFEQIAEAFLYNKDAFGHVSFAIPNDDLSLTFDINSVIVGITHGHTAGNGAGLPQKKLLDWWMKQAHGQQPVGEATILISGHYHHFSVIEAGRKVHIQCPALEGGSDWFRNMTGQQARPGLLTMIVGKDVSPAGYRSIEIL